MARRQPECGRPAPSTNGYGTFVVRPGWTYTLNNVNPAVDALAVGETLNDTFTVTTIDGTAQLVTITITGTNDAPVVTAAVDSGVVMEGPLPVMTATGTIDFGDVDLADVPVTSVTPGGSGYLGIFVADVADDSTGDGSGQVSWVFLANNQLRQSLQAGQQLVQTYTVEIEDGHGGTVSQLVTITINGTNDAAVITGDTAGSVVEAGGVANDIPGIPVANGDLFADDVDDPDDVWEAVGSATASANGYGSYMMTTAGAWTYTLDNNNATVQALNAGAPLIDSFMAVTVDGTAQLVTITITGANDAATITGDVSGGVTEDGDGVITFQTVSGNLDVTDEDTGENQLQPIATGTAGANGYGTFEVLADGAWTYTLDNAPSRRAGVAGRAGAARTPSGDLAGRHRHASDHHHHHRYRAAAVSPVTSPAPSRRRRREPHVPDGVRQSSSPTRTPARTSCSHVVCRHTCRLHQRTRHVVRGFGRRRTDHTLNNALAAVQGLPARGLQDPW